jgi:hypothetical protein
MAKSPCENCRKETCPEHGCASWSKWFVKNWNENICVKPEPANREVFQYEHPDRVREMNTAEWMAKKLEVKDNA